MKTKTKAGPPLTSQRFGHGIGVSAGIAIGAAHVVEPALGAVPEYRIASGQIDKELVRFRASAQAARAQIGKLRRKARDLPSEAGDDLLLLLDAHRGMIESERLIQGVENRIRERAINAEAAVQDWVHDLAATFAAMTDPYLAARAEDVHEVGRHILLQLPDRKRGRFHIPALPP